MIEGDIQVLVWAEEVIIVNAAGGLAVRVVRNVAISHEVVCYLSRRMFSGSSETLPFILIFCLLIICKVSHVA